MVEKAYARRRLCFEEAQVSPGDVTRVGDALLSCDARSLLATMLSLGMEQLPVEVLDSRCGQLLESKVASTLAVMRALHSSGDKPALDTLMVIPWERFEVAGAEGFFFRRMSAALLDANELPCAALTRDVVRVGSVSALAAVRGRLEGELASSSWAWPRLEESAARLAFAPWPDVLGMRIWLPRSLTEEERMQVLASIFWAMTYLGYDGSHGRWGFGERPFAEAEGWAFDDNGFIVGDYPHAPAAYARFPRGKTSGIVEVLNYNSWVDLILAAPDVSRAGKAA